MSSKDDDRSGIQLEGVAREWPELVVSGCADATISNIVKGAYRSDFMNHSKPVYKKYEKAKGLDVLIYFWDDRDGLELCGWWFGPSVGGDQVWAFHPSRTSTTPPASEWNIPNDGPIDPTFAITPRAKLEEHSGDAVRRQIESMKKERDQFAARMEEIQRRADERRRREEELKKRMRDGEDEDKKPSVKRAKLEDEARRREEEEERSRRDSAVTGARAEEERRRSEGEARQKKEEERQKRDEERRRLDEEAQRKLVERQRQEEETTRKRAERKGKEKEEERKRKEAELARRKDEEERKRKEQAKQHEERQRKLNEEAKKRKEDVSILGMIEAIARLSNAMPEDFDGLTEMIGKAMEVLLPYTGKQKAVLKSEAERVLQRTEAYVRQVDEQRRKWERWHDLQKRIPLSILRQ